ncbi:MAG: T9SS type A sorting domain-containing protein [Bacteroidetes bacterium]|nr:T9SS type A sorting domain-containing protein [Bacteroidota bacterium]HET6244269.1 T9SS type A sorting domain-containing protein [Bacteroidia bacterium]
MKTKTIYSVLTIIALFILSQDTFSQAISPYFFGQNCWMPDSIGSKKFGGQLHNKWQEIKQSNAQLIRFGGIGPDDNKPTNYQYIKMIDSIRMNGMEPIIQVPYFNGKYTASQAAAIVEYINITKGKKIKFWIIGNEPDHVYKFTSSSQVAPYIRSFSSAMKAKDPSIKIIGPETAWYNTNIINGLTSPGGPDDITGKDAAGRYYIDVISFHTYPFNGTQTRDEVISNLTVPGNFQDRLSSLNSRIINCNTAHGRTGDNALITAVTEANINFKNSDTDNLNGVGANSFIGGQFWVEMMGIGLKKNLGFFNFWSVVEGNTQALNIGYLDRNNGNKKPSYHHFKLMAGNFKGNYCNATDNKGNIKVFGSKDTTQIAVIILNQSQSSNYDFKLRLNTADVSGNNNLKINVNADLDIEYDDIIENQSTILLVFDKAGNIKKKCEYKLNGHANANLPPACTNYSDPVTQLKTIEKNEDPEKINGEKLMDFKVYPNPANNNFTINFNDGENSKNSVVLKMIDQVGRVVLNEKFTLIDGHLNKQIEINDYSIATGVYSIQIESDKNVYSTRIILTE